MKNNGFTLIELIATIVIIIFIISISIPIIKGRMDYVKEKSIQTVIKTIESATEKYVLDKREELTELDNFGFINISIKNLIDENYIDDNIVNPTTKKPMNLDDFVYVTLNYLNVLDVSYDINQKQKTRIVLNGPMNMKIKLGSTYTELGVLAQDTTGNDVSSSVAIEGTVNVNIEDTYELKYHVSNSRTISRYITVTSDFPKNDLEKPILMSNIPGNYIETNVGVNITMPSVSASDNVDGYISGITATSNNVDINNTGTYYIKYNYTDSSGNKADTLSIKVVVKP